MPPKNRKAPAHTSHSADSKTESGAINQDSARSAQTSSTQKINHEAKSALIQALTSPQFQEVYMISFAGRLVGIPADMCQQVLYEYSREIARVIVAFDSQLRSISKEFLLRELVSHPHLTTEPELHPIREKIAKIYSFCALRSRPLNELPTGTLESYSISLLDTLFIGRRDYFLHFYEISEKPSDLYHQLVFSVMPYYSFFQGNSNRYVFERNEALYELSTVPQPNLELLPEGTYERLQMLERMVEHSTAAPSTEALIKDGSPDSVTAQITGFAQALTEREGHIARQQHEIEELSGKISALEAAHSDVSQAFVRLNSDYMQQTQILTQTQSQLKTAHQNLSQKDDEIAFLKRHTAELTGEYQTLKAELESTMSELKGTQQRLSEIEHSDHQLKTDQQITRLEHELDMKAPTIEEMRRRIKTQSRELNRLKQQHEISQKRIADQERELKKRADAQENIHAFSEELDASKATCAAQREAYESFKVAQAATQAELTHALEQARNDIESRSRAIDAAQTQIHALSAQLEGYESFKASQAGKEAELTHALEQAQKELDLKSTEIQRLQGVIDRLEHVRISDHRSPYETYLEIRLLGYQDERRRLEIYLAEARAAAQEASALKVTDKHYIESLEKLCARNRIREKEFFAALRELQAANEQVRKQNRFESKCLENARQEMIQMSDQCKALQKTIDRLTRDLAENDAHIHVKEAALQAEMDALKAQLSRDDRAEGMEGCSSEQFVARLLGTLRHLAQIARVDVTQDTTPFRMLNRLLPHIEFQQKFIAEYQRLIRIEPTVVNLLSQKPHQPKKMRPRAQGSQAIRAVSSTLPTLPDTSPMHTNIT